MKVLKFGGTSLGDASRMKNVAEIISREDKVLVVLSAVSGTTNALIALVNALKGGNTVAVTEAVKILKSSYKEYISNLLSDKSALEDAWAFTQNQLDEISGFCHDALTSSVEANILARGEIISTRLFHLLLIEQGKRSHLLDSLAFLRLDKSGQPDENYLSEQLSRQLMASPDNTIFVAQGFICRDASGENTNLDRGGSDYSASLFGAAIGSEEIQIWTDIDGMHNNDPRHIKNTTPVRDLSFDEAAELAYFGAKILHPTSIKPARKKNIPVRLLNSLNPEASGTLISTETTNTTIKVVAAKSGITAIKIRSSDMLQAPGFLKRIFEVFENHQTSIDMVTTSEVAVSVTVDDSEHLQEIVAQLKLFAQIEVDRHLSIICVVGDFLVDHRGVASKVLKSLEAIPIRMISYGGSPNNISLLVSEDDKVSALKQLHKGLFSS